MKKFTPGQKLSQTFNDDDKKNYHLDFIETKSVLGIDIIRYSDYPEAIQVYVPVLFDALYRLTVKNCVNHEKYFFKKYGADLKEFKENFISTGDGGFQIFDNPIQSIIFASYFQVNIIRFNSGNMVAKLTKNLFQIIGRIELRYAITFDKIYSYGTNFFGAAIINNARILAKDKLNRLLTDFPSINWFYSNINTIENLMVMNKTDFSKMQYFIGYDVQDETLLFDDRDTLGGITAVDLLKIGIIKSKNTILEVFNLNIQLYISLPGIKKDYKNFMITLGNLNTLGIE